MSAPPPTAEVRPTTGGRAAIAASPMLPGVGLAGLSLAVVVLVGLVLGLRSTWPAFAMDSLPMWRVRPLHAGGTVALMLAGVAGLGCCLLRRVEGAPNHWLERAILWPLAAFVVAFGANVVVGDIGAMEYAPWPASLSLLPALSYLVLVCALLRVLPALTERGPEAAWLILTGMVLIPAGLLEPVLAGFGGGGFTRDLSIEWHATDTLIAGCNTALYGFGVALAAPPGGRPLRSRWLFLLAAFCLVSTFGHHHYPSGQAYTLKIIAVTASMLAAVSFLRHLRAVLATRSRDRRDPVAVLLAHAELWTLFSAGSGILLAVPWLYVVTHGTYAVVAHTMGAVVGVALMLMAASYLGFVADRTPVDAERLAGRAKWVSVVLMVMVVDLVAAGVVEGVLRVSDSTVAVSVARQVLLPMPVLGVALAISLARLGAMVLQGARTQA